MKGVTQRQTEIRRREIHDGAGPRESVDDIAQLEDDEAGNRRVGLPRLAP